MFRFVIYVYGVLKPPVYSETFGASEYFDMQAKMRLKYPNKIMNIERL